MPKSGFILIFCNLENKIPSNCLCPEHVYKAEEVRGNASLFSGLMSVSWFHPTAWKIVWWRWVCRWERWREGREAGWFPLWADWATTRRPSRSRTYAPRRPWTDTTWSRWTPTRHQAMITSAALQLCPSWGCTPGTPTGATAEEERGRAEATPVPDAWPSPTKGRTPSNSCTSSLEEEGRRCGLAVRTRWRCESGRKRDAQANDEERKHKEEKRVLTPAGCSPFKEKQQKMRLNTTFMSY